MAATGGCLCFSGIKWSSRIARVDTDGYFKTHQRLEMPNCVERDARFKRAALSNETFLK